jgi:hypothetical protein
MLVIVGNKGGPERNDQRIYRMFKSFSRTRRLFYFNSSNIGSCCRLLGFMQAGGWEMTRTERKIILWYLTNYKYIMDEIANFECLTSKPEVCLTDGIKDPTAAKVVSKYSDERINTYVRWEKIIEITKCRFSQAAGYGIIMHLLTIDELDVNSALKNYRKTKRTFTRRLREIVLFAYRLAFKMKVEFKTYYVSELDEKAEIC